MPAEALSEDENFRTLLDHLEGVAIWIISEPPEFEYVSAGIEDIWGVPAAELESSVLRMIEYIHEDDQEQLLELLDSPDAELEEMTVQHRVVRPDDEVRWVQGRLFPIEEQGVVKVVGASTDITEQKRRERQLEALNRVVRHDIRNDMAIMLGWAEMLDEHLDPAGREHLEKILTSGDHVVELTKIARDYIETLTSDEELPVSATALQPVLEREVTLCRQSYPDAEVAVGDVPDVEVTGNAMLQSVFRNLLNNAVQHNDRATPSVEVTAVEHEETVAIAIADDGPGIPDQLRSSLFDKGWKDVGSQGSGIGLYLVDLLVDQFGGDVRVEDRDPRGTIFTVELPLAPRL
ncbi:PAS domain S-box [Salinarchaeum sp. Harcht-Bsk1]|uniref:PAS domain-containing sensor histidine kinase n=1 Tax=Salinarchaeum sp. Harcht-Bsk1 TaxID=1333523 RepID=UPI0003423CBF|nr:PAS domain-containing sensor histidine kinase [Salinarchaeum sp. Harcht-Bsk1]AGN02831.1 PAS domain S-box [Salinarchaeum sp. Harcht-Bsk1]